jgi:hypothetical protein
MRCASAFQERTMIRAFADRRRLVTRLAAMAHGAWQSLTDPYQPELHYMRGPGPKWRAKHAAALGAQRAG